MINKEQKENPKPKTKIDIWKNEIEKLINQHYALIRQGFDNDENYKIYNQKITKLEAKINKFYGLKSAKKINSLWKKIIELDKKNKLEKNENKKEILEVEIKKLRKELFE